MTVAKNQYMRVESYLKLFWQHLSPGQQLPGLMWLDGEKLLLSTLLQHLLQQALLYCMLCSLECILVQLIIVYSIV